MSAPSRTTGLPRVNTPVLLSLPGVEGDLPSRVEDVRGDLVAVAAVIVPGRLERHRVGDVLTLLWAAPPRGLLSVTCVLVHEERSRLPLWVLRPTGELRRIQRRRFARADVAARVSLTGTATDLTTGSPTGDPLGGPTGSPPCSEPGWTAVGVLSDLGEGGAKVLLDPGQRVPTAVAGGLVLHAMVGGEPLVAGATVVGIDVLAAGRHQVRLGFELSERDCGRVRRAVMQRQVESRCGEDRS